MTKVPVPFVSDVAGFGGFTILVDEYLPPGTIVMARVDYDRLKGSIGVEQTVVAKNVGMAALTLGCSETTAEFDAYDITMEWQDTTPPAVRAMQKKPHKD